MGIVQWVDLVLGVLLVISGLFLIFLQVAVWLGWVTLPGPKQLQTAGWWDFLLELVKRLPPLFIVGLILIYCGLRLLGVSLS